MNFLEKYRKLNNSFSKTLVFHVGCNSGFYSELNIMVFAILYCLVNKIKFKLYSKDANFSNGKGWQEFFEPFCDEVENSFHSKYNHRFLYTENRKLIKKQRLMNKFLKFFFNFNFYTYDLFNDFRAEEFTNTYFDIKELGLKGNIQEVCKILISELIHFNSEIKSEISKLENSLNLPKDYISIHIRGGDKIIEADIFSQVQYMEFVKHNSGGRIEHIFIFTDVYKIIPELKKTYKDINFYTLCPKEDDGFYFNDFLKLPYHVQKKKLINMLASVSIMSKSRKAFGSYKTSPGMFLGIMMQDDFIGIDAEKWLSIW